MVEIILLALGGILALYLLVLYNAFSWGVVLFKFWYWFLIPVFPMLPQIGLAAAIGLTFVLTLFKTHSSHGYEGKLGGEKFKLKRKSEQSDWITGILAPWTVLSVAWLIKLVL